MVHSSNFVYLTTRSVTHLEEVVTRLSSFLISNIEPILQEWENFARTIRIDSKPLDSEGLRDHAEMMLRAI